MFPTLVKIGPVALRSYGLMLAIGFLSGYYVALKRAEKAGIKSVILSNLSLIIIFSSIIGARLMHVFANFKEFYDITKQNILLRIGGFILNIVNPFQANGEFGISGLMFYGGLIAAVIFGIWYLYHVKVNVLLMTDIFAPSIALGVFFTRIGCFLNGCCFGIPTDSVFGIVFPPMSSAGYQFPGEKIYPTQLFSSFWGIVMFGILILIEKKKWFHGFTFTIFLMLLSVGRFVIDYFRFYTEVVPVNFLGKQMTLNQLVGLFIFFGALFAFIVLSKKGKISPKTHEKGKENTSQVSETSKEKMKDNGF